MITFYKKTIKKKTIKKINNFEIGSWIDVTDPTKDEIEYLSKKFRLDKGNLFSGIDDDEIPRAEFLGETSYVILKTITENNTKLMTFLVVLSKNFILTLSKEDLTFKEKLKNMPTTQRLKMLLKIFAEINNEFEKITSKLIKEVNLDKRNVLRLTDKQINRLLEREDFLNELIAYFSYISVVYSKIIKNLNFYPDDKYLIDDLIIDTEQKLNLCKLTLKNISNIRNRMTLLASNKLNRLITLLTVFTVVITIPSAISGLYGMNVFLPFNSNKNIFYYIIGVIFIVWALFIYYLKKKNLF